MMTSRVERLHSMLNPSGTAASRQSTMVRKERVCILGSGNWGSAIARIVGQNTINSSVFEERVNMWVYEENINGRKLTEIINMTHENVRYLPNIKLPKNIVAVPDVIKAVEGATILVFVVPHQFLKGLLNQLKGRLMPNTKAISLIKGIDTANGLQLISDIIRDSLDISVSVLMGANVADEVAQEKFCETTIGASDAATGELFKKLFNHDYFRVSIVEDVAGPELCGALKNVVALGAGFVDGLELGGNTKAAVMRIGLMEMKKFAETFYGGIKERTFLESCGIGDLITTCYNGRNHRVAVAFVKTGKSFQQLESEMLRGQKLQGVGTAEEVYNFLSERGKTEGFPLFTTIYRICSEDLPPKELLKHI